MDGCRWGVTNPSRGPGGSMIPRQPSCLVLSGEALRILWALPCSNELGGDCVARKTQSLTNETRCPGMRFKDRVRIVDNFVFPTQRPSQLRTVVCI